MIRNLLLALAVLLLPSIAAADVTGQLNYTRNWTGVASSDLNPPSKLSGGQNVGVRGAGDLLVIFKNASGTEFPMGFTQAAGNFDFTGQGVPAGTYSVFVALAGQDKSLGGTNQGYRVTTVVGGGIQSFATRVQIPGTSAVWGGFGTTLNLGTRTFTDCSPARDLCPNDLVNGHQIIRWVVERWRALGVASGVGQFEAGVARLQMNTDHTNNSDCGFSMGSSNGVGCCNFDFSHVDPFICAHELGHGLVETVSELRGNQNISQGGYDAACPGAAEASPALLDEGFATLNSLLAFYEIADAANLATFDNSICFDSLAGPADNTNNCTSCEFPPSLTQYPVPVACGGDTDHTIQRTKCRVARMMVDLLDSKTVGNSQCLSETAVVPLGSLLHELTQIAPGTGEGQFQERTVGAPGIGNATDGSKDGYSMMDLLNALRGHGLLTTDNAYRIWANGCYMPGDAAWPAGTFLPAGGARPAPF